MLIERYPYSVRGTAAANACRAASTCGDPALTACAAACGAKVSCETVLRHRAHPRPGQPRLPARPQPRPLGHRKRAAPPPRHNPRQDASRLAAGGSWRLFAAIANMTVSVLNRAGHRNQAAARRDCAWDRTGLLALELLGL